VSHVPPTEISAAVRDLDDGRTTRARLRLMALWEHLEHDSPHRCAAAHWLAAAQPDIRSTLTWGERALREAEKMTDRHVPFAGTLATLAAIYPQLQLDLARDYWRLRDSCGALEHLVAARDSVADRPDDAVRRRISRDIARLDAEMCGAGPPGWADSTALDGEPAWTRRSWGSWEDFWTDDDQIW
jgi:hypothetical protein